MPTRGHNGLEGTGELLLSLVWRHCTPQQWVSWLKIALQGAASEGDAEMVAALLKAGTASTSLQPNDSLLPLHAAARGGSLDVVWSLLKSSLIRDVNKISEKTGRTPLYIAVKYGHADIASALVRAGGDVNLADTHGWSPLIQAAFDGRAQLVTNLLMCGSQVNAKSKSRNEALYISVRQGHLGVVKVLLKAGACPGTRGQDNLSSVDLAVKRGDADILSELLDASAPDLDVLDDGGDSALCIAVENGSQKAIHMLVDAGMSLDAQMFDESLPLHLACFYCQPRSVQALLRRNADKDIRDHEHDLPEEIVGHGIPETERDNAVVGDIRKLTRPQMLARAPADRIWRRRGWLAMLKARERATDNEHRRRDHDNGAGNNQGGKVEPPSGLSSRRKLAGRGESATDDAVHVHPTLKKFCWIVTKMVDVADEPIFRKIVSYV